MTSAILLAAGSGSRAGFEENKILREINGLPVLSYSLSAFAPYADELLVVCRKEDEEDILPLLSPYENARTVYGGSTRAESALLALRQAKGEYVLVHDAARPYASARMIENCLKSAKEYGSGVCCVPAVDTTAIRVEDGRLTEISDRKQTFSLQTPQAYRTKELLSAYEQAFREGKGAQFTDESGLYLAYCRAPKLVEGDKRNKKLTYAEDFLPAERVGFGVDTHPFGAPCNYVVLAGVKVPHESGLVAHSDGDVLVHAVMDALLSAAGLRDIGYYFPDTDESLRGADSMELLRKVTRLLTGEGFAVKNVSVSVLAERPRLSAYIPQMKQNLAAALRVEESAVGIAAGTNEKLGYVGEGKGITAYATALLR